MKKDKPKVLVAYFSATGNTEAKAKEVAELTDGTLYRIEPVVPYTEEDLDADDPESRSAVEMGDRDLRPEIKNGKIDTTPYDVVFLGYPIWWDQAPREVNTFLDMNDFKGKEIITFCTSSTSYVNISTDNLKFQYPNLEIVKGERLNDMDTNEIQTWINSLL